MLQLSAVLRNGSSTWRPYVVPARAQQLQACQAAGQQHCCIIADAKLLQLQACEGSHASQAADTINAQPAQMPRGDQDSEEGRKNRSSGKDM